MRNLAQHVSTKTTPQSQAIRGTNQQMNNAGGYSYVLSKWDRLQRFLILGSEGGTYYVGEKKLTEDNAGVVLECAREDADNAVKVIAQISESGRAPKNDAAIFALALIASEGDLNARRLALQAMPRVCRTGTHLFQFVAACKELRGWGRGLREAVSGWYNNRPLDKLAYQVTKYRNRAGYTHRDLLRLSHPKTEEISRNCLYHWLTKGTFPDVDSSLAPGMVSTDLRLVTGLEIANSLSPSHTGLMVKVINDYGLTLEHVPTHFLNQIPVWEALLPHLPPTALIRNLGKMTSIGLLKPLSTHTKYVCDELTNIERLRSARVHPLSILVASATYQRGRGVKGSLQWNTVDQIMVALEEAFYNAFDAVEPTGKRHLLALDVSGSMTQALGDLPLSARDASACMALVTARVEPQTHIMGFTNTLVPLKITRKDTLTSAIRNISNLPFGGTDCAMPMLYAMQNKIEVDSFIVYTDNETWAGRIHPSQALRQYRQTMGIDAKLIVVGMVSNGFSIADPNDPGMLDVVGFDTSCPAVMADFVR